MTTPEYEFFWKSQSPFSQWYPSIFKDEQGITYNCAEMYMMYHKAMLFGDTETAELILNEPEPRKQKEMGRKVKGFSESIWNSHCREIVTQGNYFKFSQNPRLKKILLDTGARTLAEASPYDRIWGIGYAEDEALDNVRNWGTNYLGKCLMTVRFKLMNKE